MFACKTKVVLCIAKTIWRLRYLRDGASGGSGRFLVMSDRQTAQPELCCETLSRMGCFKEKINLMEGDCFNDKGRIAINEKC